MEIEAILAIATNGVIGSGNSLPWHLADDMRYFKNITTGHAIVMGRKTHQSIGRVLPNRANLVLTSNANQVIDGAIPISSVRQAIEIVSQTGMEKLFVLGGPSVWLAFEGLLTRVHLTRVHGTPDGDTRFVIPYQWYEWNHKLVAKLEKEDARNEYPFTTWSMIRRSLE